MGNSVKVGMADLKVAKAPDSLITLGLGSCIGLTLYDPVTKVGGMVHYILSIFMHNYKFILALAIKRL